MKSFRKDRAGSLIREKLGWLVEREVEVEGALITITEVDVDKKLDQAVVYVSVLPSEKSQECLKKLTKRAGEFQFRLLRILNIRPMPRIMFVADHGLENAAQVEKALLDDSIKE